MRTLFAVVILGVTLHAQEKPADSMKDCPMHEQHQHDHDMQQRGNEGMGFDQNKTTHHFLLHKDGGAIQVTANAANDDASVSQIRMHLKHIAKAFQSGDFNIPMFVHNQTPPGVAAMQKLKNEIAYKYEDAPQGGRVVIRSTNEDAVGAIQEFLRFQIKEHKTGDAL